MRRLFVAGAAGVVLAGCGGGFFVGIGDVFGGDPPNVSMAAPATARAGQTVRLVAAAADDVGIERVSFFRVEGTTSVEIGSDAQSPYAVDATMPASPTGSVEFFARAFDVEGLASDSASVFVDLVP